MYHEIMMIKKLDPGELVYANYKYYDNMEEFLENEPPHSAADEVSTKLVSYQP